MNLESNQILSISNWSQPKHKWSWKVGCKILKHLCWQRVFTPTPPPHAHDAPLACLPALGFASLRGHQSVLPAIGGAPHYWCLKLPPLTHSSVPLQHISCIPCNYIEVIFWKIKKASDTLTRSGEESSFWQHWYWQRVFQHWYWRKFLLILTASRRPIKLSAHSQLAGNLEIMHGWKNYQIIKNQWLFWIFPSAFQAKTQAHL